MTFHGPYCFRNALDGSAKQSHQILYSLLTLAFAALMLVLSPPPARAQGQLTIEPSAAYFGSVWVGRTHSIRATLKNSGNVAVTISGDSLTGSGYSVSGLTVPKTLSAGATITFEIGLSPATVGAVSGTLQLISNAANSALTVPLSGEGVASEAAGYAAAQPLSAQFGNVPVGTQNTEIIDIKNTGGRTFSITNVTANGTGFSILGISTPVSVAPDKSAQFTVRFLPQSAGSSSGSVSVTSTASDSQLTIVLSGNGIGSSRELNVTPASIAFGNVNMGGSATQQITLKNAGNSNVSISAATVSGSGLQTTGMAAGTALTPGQTALMSVQFAPVTAGNVTCSITIASNAANGTVTIPVTGTGVSVAHAVDLQWQASTSSGVTGYDIYRSTVSGGSYNKLTSSPVAGTSYADTSVTAGVEYYYVVTAVSSDGSQSGYSNQAAITVP